MKLIHRAGAVVLVVALVAGAFVGRAQLSSADTEVASAWGGVARTYAERIDSARSVLTAARAEQGFDANAVNALDQAVAQASTHPPVVNLIQDPEAFDKFKQYQAQLTGAMYQMQAAARERPTLRDSSAMVVMTAYLDNADEHGRLNVVRKQYSDAVNRYNDLANAFPRNVVAMVFGFHNRPEFVHMAR